MASRIPLVMDSSGNLEELQSGDTLTVGTYTNATFASVIAPTSVTAATSVYSGTTQYVEWQINQTATLANGAIDFYGYETSTDNSTWSSESFCKGPRFLSPSFTSGNQYARVRAYPLVIGSNTVTPSSWVGSSAVAYAAANLPLKTTQSANLVGTRTPGTTYQNTSGYPMFVKASAYNNAAGQNLLAQNNSTSTLSNIDFASFPSSGYAVNVSMIVPPNYYYTITISGGTITYLTWYETTIGG